MLKYSGTHIFFSQKNERKDAARSSSLPCIRVPTQNGPLVTLTTKLRSWRPVQIQLCSKVSTNQQTVRTGLGEANVNFPVIVYGYYEQLE